MNKTAGFAVEEGDKAEKSGDKLKAEYFRGIGNTAVRALEDLNYMLETGKAPDHARRGFVEEDKCTKKKRPRLF